VAGIIQNLGAQLEGALSDLSHPASSVALPDPFEPVAACSVREGVQKVSGARSRHESGDGFWFGSG
jgi:hypothetical protein